MILKHHTKTILALALAPALLLIQACSDGSDTIDPNSTPSPLTISPMAVPEGAPGEMNILRFHATVTHAQPRDISIRYETSANTATAGQDYFDTAGELVIPAGALHGFIEVELIGDAEEEPGETFTLSFETSDNATATSASAIGTIANDDTACDAPFDNIPNPWLVHGADPLNFAHRGGVTDFPENTLYAYSEAAKAGADVLEMDVFQTKDKQLVILHDEEGVGNTTNGEGRVIDLTLQELKALDAAYWFIPGEGPKRNRPEEDYVFRGIATGDKAPPPGYSAEDFKIPTLQEALSRFSGNLINVELKENNGQVIYAQQLVDMLLSYGRLNDLIVASFSDQAVEDFKAMAPCIYTSLPLGQGLGIFAVFLATGEFQEVPEHIAAQIPPDASQIGDQIPGDEPIPIVTADLVEAAHAINFPIQVWTINECEEMLQMIDLGVDGIMTDQVLLLESLLAQPPTERSCK